MGSPWTLQGLSGQVRNGGLQEGILGHTVSPQSHIHLETQHFHVERGRALSLQMGLVKMRSGWVWVGPNPTCLMSLQEKDRHRGGGHVRTGERPV